MFLGWTKIVSAASGMFEAYRKDCRGNIGVLFALSILPVIIAAGAAVDYGRAINAKSHATAVLETAAIYAATMATTTTDQGRLSAVQHYINSNHRSSGDAALSGVSVTNYSHSVTVNATAIVRSSFLHLAGIPAITIPVSVEVKKSGINLEISLVLDNTGSMNTKDPGAANTPIVDLKTAATNFIKTVLPASQGSYYTKIALIPYNNSVNLGSSTLATSARGSILSSPSTSTSPGYSNYKFNSATGQSQTYPSSNCVSERQGSKAYTDDSAAIYPVGLLYGPTGYNDCSVTPMVPLSTSATTLNAAINSMSAGMSTAGQVGIAWGWYALSPKIGLWSGASVPAGYDKLTTLDHTKKVKKIMILMTDAEYNSAYCNGVISQPSSLSGSGATSYQIPCSSPLGNSYVQSNAMCNAIKASGVEIYVITFQLDKSIQQRADLVNNCASDPSHILNAANSAQLNTVFQNLANSINSLHVSR